jgi:hypothetical protein
LTVTGIVIVICSCLALVAALSMALFLWFEYLMPSHLGSVRGITEAFYVELSLTVFELCAFVLGLLSAVNIFKLKRFSLSALGTSFLLIAGLLFFVKYLYDNLPHVELIFYSPWSPITPQPWFGIPVIILASISLILLVSKKKEFTHMESYSIVTLKALLVLTSVISVLFILFSFVPYSQAAESARIQHTAFPNHTAYYSLATMIISICTFIFATLSGILLTKKNSFYAPIILMIISLLTALSVPFIFMTIYPWIGEFYKGLMTESPVIVLSAVALALALLGQRGKVN